MVSLKYKIEFLQDWIRFQTNNDNIIMKHSTIHGSDEDYASVETNIKHLDIIPWEIHNLLSSYMGEEFKISYFYEYDRIEFFRISEEIKNLPFIPDLVQIDRKTELIAWGAD